MLALGPKFQSYSQHFSELSSLFYCFNNSTVYTSEKNGREGRKHRVYREKLRSKEVLLLTPITRLLLQVPSPSLVPRSSERRGAVSGRGVAADGRASAHPLAERHHDDGRPRRRTQHAGQGGSLLRRQGDEHLLPDQAGATLHTRGDFRRQEIGERSSHRRFPAGDLRLAEEHQALQLAQTRVQGLEKLPSASTNTHTQLQYCTYVQ